MFKRHSSFTGRSTRGEFFYAILMMAICLAVCVFIVEQFRIRNGWVFSGLIYSLTLLNLTLMIPTQVRRLHDLNMSGYWVWIFIILSFITYVRPDLGFVDVINIGLNIVLTLIPSQHKTNRFGSDPTADINGFYRYYSNRLHVHYGAYGLTTNHMSVSDFQGGYNNLAKAQVYGSHSPYYSSTNASVNAAINASTNTSVNAATTVTKSDLAGSKLFKQTMQHSIGHFDLQNSRPTHYSSTNTSVNAATTATKSDLAGSKLFKQTMQHSAGHFDLQNSRPTQYSSTNASVNASINTSTNATINAAITATKSDLSGSNLFKQVMQRPINYFNSQNQKH